MSTRMLPVMWAKHRAAALRNAAAETRNAYRQPYMGEPCAWFAAVLDEAADLIERRAAEIKGESDFPPIVHAQNCSQETK